MTLENILKYTYLESYLYYTESEGGNYSRLYASKEKYENIIPMQCFCDIHIIKKKFLQHCDQDLREM